MITEKVITTTIKVKPRKIENEEEEEEIDPEDKLF